MEPQPTVEELFEDLETRFLLNLPPEELAQPERLFMQIEQAHWYYEDFYADAYAHIPHMNMRRFAAALFSSSPLLQPIRKQYSALFDNFRSYKGSIPVYGCVFMNDRLDHIVLVKSYNGNTWSFPKGKINEGEDPADCAVRECLEETGYDAGHLCDRDAYITVFNGGQMITLYCIVGVPLDFRFETQTRKEIRDIKFFPLNKLPSRTWLVAQFKAPMLRFIKKHRKKLKRKARKAAAAAAAEKGAAAAAASAGGDDDDGDDGEGGGVTTLQALEAELGGFSIEDPLQEDPDEAGDELGGYEDEDEDEFGLGDPGLGGPALDPARDYFPWRGFDRAALSRELAGLLQKA